MLNGVNVHSNVHAAMEQQHNSTTIRLLCLVDLSHMSCKRCTSKELKVCWLLMLQGYATVPWSAHTDLTTNIEMTSGMSLRIVAAPWMSRRRRTS